MAGHGSVVRGNALRGWALQGGAMCCEAEQGGNRVFHGREYLGPACRSLILRCMAVQVVSRFSAVRQGEAKYGRGLA